MKLIIIAGPTASGKTARAVALARELGTEIIGCDSRQFYSELRIGVARPTDEELKAAKHHFVACRSVKQPYNIFDYERDAMEVVRRLFEKHECVVACGGSGLYIDALIQRPAVLPDPSTELRAMLQAMPIDEKRERLKDMDPRYYERVDKNNPVRLQRALEVCITAGRPYSDLLAEQHSKRREFEIEVQMTEVRGAELRERIDARVDAMIEAGLVDEVKAVSHLRGLNTLNTVGYRELFPVIDGRERLDRAVEQIKLNTWHYAKKQLTWMRKYATGSAYGNLTNT